MSDQAGALGKEAHRVEAMLDLLTDDLSPRSQYPPRRGT